MKMLSVLTLLLVSFSAHAASIGSCEGLDSIGNLIGSTKSFAKGSVKVAYVSTEEPASAPDHVLIFVYDNEMGVTCAAVNNGPEGQGFGWVNMDKLSASYDPAKGLLLLIPVHVWTGEDGKYADETVRVRVDRRDASKPVFTIER